MGSCLFFAFLLPPFSLVFGLQGALQDKGHRQRDRLFCSLICCLWFASAGQLPIHGVYGPW